MKKVGALWGKTAKDGNPFFSGKIEDRNILVFKVKNRRSEKSPDYEIFDPAQEDEKKEEGVPF